jgi:nucleotidyltransferase/DNA polymerase involved in DNA repair/arsenate reductase-like glutaredoxin family protein
MENPSYDELKEWLALSELPFRKFFNTSGQLYKSLGLKDKLPSMSEEDCLRLLTTNGMLVKRPLLVDYAGVLVGFNHDAWESFLSEMDSVPTTVTIDVKGNEIPFPFEWGFRSGFDTNFVQITLVDDRIAIHKPTAAGAPYTKPCKAGDPEARHGIILAKNELAKKYKIRTAETIWSAKKKCPELVLVPPRHKIYGEFCERVNAIYEQYSPLVERFGIDESFLDVTGCLHPFGEDVMKCAHAIRERVKREIGITISVGVSWNKIFAKLGSDMKKPDAVTAIPRGNWKELVFPLPVSDLFLVGKKTADELAKIGVSTIGGLASCDRDFLIRRFGKMGEQLHRNANGLDDSPVAAIGEGDALKSVGNGFTFKRDLVSDGDIQVAVTYLSDSVATRLRKHNFKCRVVQVAIKDTNLKSITRQTTLPRRHICPAKSRTPRLA